MVKVFPIAPTPEGAFQENIAGSFIHLTVGQSHDTSQGATLRASPSAVRMVLEAFSTIQESREALGTGAMSSTYLAGSFAGAFSPSANRAADASMAKGRPKRAAPSPSTNLTTASSARTVSASRSPR